MKTYHPPSGLQYGLDLMIDSDWSPEQAFAVINLLDDLRDRIWIHYEIALYQKFREDQIIGFDDDADNADPPF